MTVVVKPDTDLTPVSLPNEKNKKLQRFFKLFHKMMRANDNTIRSRRNSDMLAVDGNLFKIKDLDKIYGRPITENFYKKSNRNVKKKEKTLNILKTAYQTFDTYCDNTTLHGLRYVGDSNLTIFERIFWLLAFSCAVSFACYFISNIYDKYNNSPVIVSFNPTSESISSIPFPAVTICNLNQVIKAKAQVILKDGNEIEKKLLDDFCNSNSTFPNSTITSDEELTNWGVVNKFITKVTQSCGDMLKSCQWRQNEMDCNQLFNNYFTDDGLCCIFNRLPNSFIFKNLKEVEEELNNSTFIVEDWSPEKGFSTLDVQMNTTPFRAIGPGSHMGLTIVVDAAVDEYYCSSTSSTGFKVLLSNPIETPKMADYGFLVSPGFEARIVVEPAINDATPTLESIDISKRQCFFSSERFLRYYRTYTERNCQLECQSNYTLDRCGCVSYFLPRNKKTKICSKQDDVCSNEAKLLMEMSTPRLSRLNCNCLPGCFELGYAKATSLGKLSNKFKIRENILGKENLDYFVKNMAVIHFFYEKGQFTKHTKSEIYGFTEFLSNTGGLLGLFLGFSFLSAVELGYYLSLKVLCDIAKYKKKLKAKQDLVYPFTK